MPDHSYLVNRAVVVFGTRPFLASSIAVEVRRRNADVMESIEALVAEGRLVVVEEQPARLYKVKEQS